MVEGGNTSIGSRTTHTYRAPRAMSDADSCDLNSLGSQTWSSSRRWTQSDARMSQGTTSVISPKPIASTEEGARAPELVAQLRHPRRAAPGRGEAGAARGQSRDAAWDRAGRGKTTGRRGGGKGREGGGGRTSGR